MIRAYGILKKAAAVVNKEFGLSCEIVNAIGQAADEVISGELYQEHFPVIIWATTTQTHMNVNEVISNRAIEIMKGVVGSKKPVHPNDHVNLGQSSNDTFPTAMHIAVAQEINSRLIPSLEYFRDVLCCKEAEFDKIIKIGRTHMQDAVPMSLGQEFSCYKQQIQFCIERIYDTLPRLYMLPMGGTAIGTGMNTFEGFSEKCCCKIAEYTCLPFVKTPNLFEGTSADDSMIEVSGALNVLAAAYLKITNDIRILSSGPRNGLAEIKIPENEPGSSIMGGKVNPTQCDSAAMVAAHVMGAHVSITVGGAFGHLELNTCKPLMVANVLRSVRLLADSTKTFAQFCASGIKANTKKIEQYVKSNLIIGTALNNHIGYEKTAAIIKKALKEGIILKDAATKSGYWKKKGIPYEKPTLFFGNLSQAMLKKTNGRELIEIICKKYEGHRYFGFYQFSMPSLVVLDPELIKDICVKNFDSFTDHTDFLPRTTDTFVKKMLFSRDGEAWNDMRTILTPTFTSRKLKAMFHIVVERSEMFVNHFAKQAGTVTIEVKDAFAKFTNDVMAICTLGLECNSFEDENNEIYTNGKDATDFSGWKAIRFFGYSCCPSIAALLGITFFSNKVRNFFTRITKDVISYREKNNVVRPDVIHLLKEAQKGRLSYVEEDDNHDSGFASIQEAKQNNLKNLKISDDDIITQVISFFFGSNDTTSTVLSHVAYELVVNTNIQQELINEIDTTLSDNNGKITYEALCNMEYLDKVISETLRMWPPPPILNRKCIKTYVIEPKNPNEKALVVEPGTDITIPVVALHNNSKYYKDPHIFNPERFNNENKSNINPYTYLGFGIGPRHCIGNRFALMLMKTIIVTILSHYEIVRVPQTMIPFELNKNTPFLHSASGYWFGFKPRHMNLEA
ncbi:hypothetical protein FQA39_LY09239 [Lamprigera yunnana]|nr:hypothetical protein FQA39_LY09239 [Lamprigera yunnana]